MKEVEDENIKLKLENAALRAENSLLKNLVQMRQDETRSKTGSNTQTRSIASDLSPNNTDDNSSVLSDFGDGKNTELPLYARKKSGDAKE